MSIGLNGNGNGVASPENYARRALEAECQLAASTGRGRNDQLNKSALAIGQLVGAGAIELHEAEFRLMEAAKASGYVQKDGIAAARATIKSGLEAGIKNPRKGLSSTGAAPARPEPKPRIPKLSDVPVPDWTVPDADGKPKLFAIGRDQPPVYDDDMRRHIYWRDGAAVRIKVKKTGSPQWVDLYRVRRPSDGAIGWQTRKPPEFVPLPYIGPAGANSPFVTTDNPLVWAEGEKDVDTLRKHGVDAFTFGGATDVPDCADLVRDRVLYIAGDNDVSGEKGITKKIVFARPHAASINLLRFADFGDGGDVTDFFDRGGTVEGLFKRATEYVADPGPPVFGDPIEALIERFNDKYMVVNEAGKAMVFQPGYDPVIKRRRHDRMAVRDLQTLYMNETIEVGRDDKDRPITKPVAEVWLKHPARRQYINGITFDPTAAQQDGVLNLWEGFAVQPAAGDWSLMRAHIRDVLCDGDDVRFEYLMGWMARMLQQPAEQGEVAVVMRGGEGTGKGSLAKALMRIMGHHGLAIANAKHLIGNFNAHLRDCVYLFADEAFFAGDRSHVGTLKSLITEPHLPIEGKYQNVVLAPNFLHLMMASNEEWVVPASLDARRFFVLEVSEAVKGNHGHFAAIWAQMEAGGYEAMLHDLLAFDLTTFNVRAVPTTEGLQHQRKLSLATTEAWWLDCLERGYVFKSKIGLHEEFGEWRDIVTTELLFASYSEFAKARGERRPLIREHLGRSLKEFGAGATRPRHGLIGEEMRDIRNEFGNTSRQAVAIEKDRPSAYFLGDLETARAGFAKATRIALVWDGADVAAADTPAKQAAVAAPLPRSGRPGSGQSTYF